MNEELNINKTNYSDENIKHLEGLEAVRKRPGMYIGQLGDGSQSEDGIYILFKEVIDNSIDEFRMKFGNKIDITADKHTIAVRDYGRGIPQGSIVKAVSVLHTGGKFDSAAFQKSIGMNGVGLKAVNALSSNFIVRSFREGKVKEVRFEKGILQSETALLPTTEPNGTYIEFTPDNSFGIFENYFFREDFLEERLRNYSYLNTGLTFNFNSKKFCSKNGLLDLLDEKITSEPLYPIVHLKGEDIEIAFTHTEQSREEYYSFVNGQYTWLGGTHQSAFREIFGKTVKDFYGKNMEYSDIRTGIAAAIYIAAQEPVFADQAKTKLSSNRINAIDPNSPTIQKFIGDFAIKEIDDFLHKNPNVADILLKKIQANEKERKAIAGITKADKKKAQKIDVNNPKLRDCKVHFNDNDKKITDSEKAETSIFITEGDSASGSITKTRNASYQAVFSLRGKPLNSYGETKQIVYKNQEFNLLQAALNIEDGLEGLRYNRVIIATDADVDGMHIRLLLMTFFLQFFPDLVKKGHVYILQTPLFRVRNKKETIYCYSEEERDKAIKKLGANPEITRFKGLGEINPDEFKSFIGKDIRLDKVPLRKEDAVADMLGFYMGKNTRERQEFIVDNLNIEAE